MTVLTFDAMSPPARQDGEPWTQVVIFEAASANGPWTEIQTIGFADPDDNPADPKSRVVTTTEATAETGLWYSFIFEDADANASPRSPAVYSGGTVTNVNYRPTVRDVADNIRARTIDEFDNEVGTFTSETTPTGAQVEKLIDDAVDEVSSILGAEVPAAPAPNPDLYRLAAQNLTATLAAAKVEITHFGKEVARENSPYDKLMDEFNRQLLWLATKLGITIPGDTPGGDDVPSGSHTAIWGNEVTDPWTDMMTRPT